MADNSPILKFPFVRSGQTQKEVTVNEALTLLEAAVQLVVVSTANQSPASPTVGDRYVVGSAPTGDWSSYTSGDVMVRIEGGWRRFTPLAGWQAYFVTTGRMMRFVASAWVDIDKIEAKLTVALSGTGATITSATLSISRFVLINITASGVVTLPSGVAGPRRFKVVGTGTATIGGVAVVAGTSADLFLSGTGTAEAM
jgi:hypothetical protein